MIISFGLIVWFSFLPHLLTLFLSFPEANPPISGNIEEEEAEEDILENETQEVPADSGELKPVLGMFDTDLKIFGSESSQTRLLIESFLVIYSYTKAQKTQKKWRYKYKEIQSCYTFNTRKP